MSGISRGGSPLLCSYLGIGELYQCQPEAQRTPSQWLSVLNRQRSKVAAEGASSDVAEHLP